MLINQSWNTISKGDLATFKLANGDEIVARVEELLDGPGDYRVSNPMTVVPSQQGVALFPSLITAKDKPTVTLQRCHILMSASTTPELEAHYTQLVTGIVTAPAGIMK